jgi:hypothetical protein
VCTTLSLFTIFTMHVEHFSFKGRRVKTVVRHGRPAKMSVDDVAVRHQTRRKCPSPGDLSSRGSVRTLKSLRSKDCLQIAAVTQVGRCCNVELHNSSKRKSRTPVSSKQVVWQGFLQSIASWYETPTLRPTRRRKKQSGDISIGQC